MIIVLNLDFRETVQKSLFDLVSQMVKMGTEEVTCKVEGYMPILTTTITIDTVKSKVAARAIFTIITVEEIQTLVVEDNPFTIAEIEESISLYRQTSACMEAFRR